MIALLAVRRFSWQTTRRQVEEGVVTSLVCFPRAGSTGDIRMRSKQRGHQKRCENQHIHNWGDPEFPNHSFIRNASTISLLIEFHSLYWVAVSSSFLLSEIVGAKLYDMHVLLPSPLIYRPLKFAVASYLLASVAALLFHISAVIHTEENLWRSAAVLLFLLFCCARLSSIFSPLR